MPIKIVRPNHFELLGEGYVLLTAPHAAGPEAELYTGKIVEDAALTSRCYAVAGNVSPEYEDPTRIQAARAELRSSVEAMLEENGIKCLLDVRGKKGAGVEIDISDRTIVSLTTIELVKARLSKRFAVARNPQSGGPQPQDALKLYSGKESGGEPLFEALNLSFGQTEIQLKRELVVNSLVELVALLNQELSFKREAKHPE